MQRVVHLPALHLACQRRVDSSGTYALLRASMVCGNRFQILARFVIEYGMEH